MIGEDTAGKKTDSDIHESLLQKKSTKAEEYAILRLVRMGYTEEEAVKLLKGQ